MTIRRLGEELGIGSATLYWHVSGKDELFELVYERIMGEIELPAHLVLAHVIGEPRRPQRALDLAFLRGAGARRDQPVGFDGHPGIL